MSDTLGYIMEAAIGVTVGAVGMYVLGRTNGRHLAATTVLRFTTPPCLDCGKPSGSPRLNQCDPCHAKATVAAFDAHVAMLRQRARLNDGF